MFDMRRAADQGDQRVYEPLGAADGSVVPPILIMPEVNRASQLCGSQYGLGIADLPLPGKKFEGARHERT
jgi:hypothetical protein